MSVKSIRSSFALTVVICLGVATLGFCSVIPLASSVTNVVVHPLSVKGLSSTTLDDPAVSNGKLRNKFPCIMLINWFNFCNGSGEILFVCRLRSGQWCQPNGWRKDRRRSRNGPQRISVASLTPGRNGEWRHFQILRRKFDIWTMDSHVSRLCDKRKVSLSTSILIACCN